jgi:signal transduction histidine kinase
MFTAVRIRLIAYVVGVLALMLLATGALVYVLLSRQLDAALDMALRSSSNRIGGVVTTAMSLPPDPRFGTLVADGVPQTATADQQATLVGPTSQTGSVMTITGFGGIPAPVPNSTADDTFALSFDANTGLITTYGEVPLGLPDRSAIEAARSGREDLRTVEADGRRYRLLTRVVLDPRGEPRQVTQSGIPLDDRERQQRAVLLALVGGGMLGLTLTVAGGLFLTSRALAPVQLAFDQQRRFVSDASHELRTPLTLLRAEAEALARRFNAARETRPLLGQIDRISRLVHDLLTLARLDERALPLEREPVPVLALLRTAAGAAERLAGPGIVVEVDGDAGLCVDGDPDRLHQVLLILVDNACRVTPPGGRIGLVARRDGNEVRIHVEDTGPGIPREHLVRIFERFYRVDAARTRDEGGSGLGLAIARGIVDAHGGAIDVVSRVGYGTMVTLSLPVAPA